MIIATENELQSLSIRIAATNDSDARLKFYHELVTSDPHRFNSVLIPFESVAKGSRRVCIRRDQPVYALVPRELHNKLLSIPQDNRTQSHTLRKMIFELYDQVSDYVVNQREQYKN